MTKWLASDFIPVRDAIQRELEALFAEAGVKEGIPDVYIIDEGANYPSLAIDYATSNGEGGYFEVSECDARNSTKRIAHLFFYGLVAYNAAEEPCSPAT
jgi:hypothetical protein